MVDMDTMKLLRLVVSAGAVLVLAVGLIVVAALDGDKSTLVVLGAALTAAIPTLMTQLSAESAGSKSDANREDTKKQIQANTAVTAQTAATVAKVAEATGIPPPSPAAVQDVLEKSLPRP